MEWIKSHTTTCRHRKILGLADQLKIKPVMALGYMTLLWHTAGEQQEDGDFSGWTNTMLARVLDWEGNPDELVCAMQENGFLDGRVIHDWLDYAGEALRKKYSSSNRQKLIDIWRKYGREYAPAEDKEASKKKGKSDAKKEANNNTEPAERAESDSLATPQRQAREHRVEKSRAEQNREQQKDFSPGPDKPGPERSPFWEQAGLLVDRLVALMVRNNPGCKIPADLKEWRRAADALLRIDKRPYSDAVRVLEWCQQEPFWLKNILSMPKFREKYDRLLLDCKGRKSSGGGLPSPAGKYSV